MSQNYRCLNFTTRCLNSNHSLPELKPQASPINRSILTHICLNARINVVLCVLSGSCTGSVASIGIIGIISSCIVHLITMHELHSGHLRTIFVGISEPLNPLPAGRASWSNINGEKSQQPTAISCFTKKRNSMLLLLFAHIYMHHASAAQKHWSNMKHEAW